MALQPWQSKASRVGLVLSEGGAASGPAPQEVSGTELISNRSVARANDEPWREAVTYQPPCATVGRWTRRSRSFSTSLRFRRGS